MIGTHKLNTVNPAGLGQIDRDISLHGTLWVVAVCLAVLATLLVPGCSNPSVAHAVDSPQARDALKVALEQWKKGETPASLESASTPMVVQDIDWSSGKKLVAYQILDEGKAEDANLRVRVNLSLDGGPASGKNQGKAAEKKVWYLVTTSPSVTVFRDMLKR